MCANSIFTGCKRLTAANAGDDKDAADVLRLLGHNMPPLGEAA